MEAVKWTNVHSNLKLTITISELRLLLTILAHQQIKKDKIMPIVIIYNILRIKIITTKMIVIGKFQKVYLYNTFNNKLACKTTFYFCKRIPNSPILGRMFTKVQSHRLISKLHRILILQVVFRKQLDQLIVSLIASNTHISHQFNKNQDK